VTRKVGEVLAAVLTEGSEEAGQLGRVSLVFLSGEVATYGAGRNVIELS
jgi:hypothetical protein